ncbi:ATP-binding protein [Streptomyces sp. NBC_01262]|uniref:ATP-binding protein n=1 Tax=Streptomyces sp. NBC_01262 TaxID=2903803 RepID=UPI002E309CC9|nr:ATP-binding protein [Streptomyces sp. NBC_01262]
MTDLAVEPGSGVTPQQRSASLRTSVDRPDSFIVSCTSTPERVAQLRRICAAHLRLWGIDDCIETATLLLSELVTNAVRYGDADEFTLCVSHGKGQVRIDVRDGAPARPQVRRPGPEEESGRGMLIVDALSEDWGTSQDGTRTWCTITVPAPFRASAGFWCEWRMADGERLASFASPLPTSAIRWARIQMRIIAAAVGQPAIGYLWDWLSDGWREPAEALYQGEEFTLPLTAGPYSFVWHARPVRFLPLVGGIPLPHVPREESPWE